MTENKQENKLLTKKSQNVVITAKVMDCEISENTKKDGAKYWKRILMLKGTTDGVKAKFALTQYFDNALDCKAYEDDELVSFVPMASYKDPLATIEIKGMLV